jgi:type 1 glutamine amidotransferase
MSSVTRRQAILTATAAGAGAWAAAADPAAVRVLIVVGPTDHPPGTHEVAAGGRLIKHGLETADLGDARRVRAEVVTEWPAGRLDDVACVVFIGDLFPPAVMAGGDRAMADLAAMAARGCGMVCVHYATGLEARHVAGDGDHPLLRWIGGYFATRCKHHASVARVFPKAAVEPAKLDHPVLRGWKAFTLHDEPYINNYFGQGGPAAGVTVLATADLPPEKPKAEPVAWAAERPDGGRGVGVVMPHFYRNWANDDLRTLLFNAMVWAAKLDVPAGGVRVRLPDLAEFRPVSVEPVPRKAAPAWAMSPPLFRLAGPDADDPVPLVDPAVVRHDGKWHLFAGARPGCCTTSSRTSARTGRRSAGRSCP